MSEVQVVKLSKAYKTYPSQWARLAEWLIPNSKPRHTLKWVLQDISFHIKPGEALGVVGMNGGVKRTVLQILAGTTWATSGLLAASRRFASLLEFVMALHPELTGRHNIYMAGQLLDLSMEDLHALMRLME